MDEITTVYFDTCFYIWLGNASEDQAMEAITTLNSHHVRPVQSLELVAELLRTTGHPETDANIVERVGWFDAEPLVTHLDASWDALLVHGDERDAIAQQLRAHEPGMSAAEATTWVAHEGSEEQQREMMAQLGVDEGNAHEFGAQMARSLLGREMADVIEEAKRLGNGEPDHFNYFQAVMATQGADPHAPWLRLAFEFAQQHRQLHSSVVGERALAEQIALGEAKDGKHRVHQNDLRDIGHMETFIKHKGSIDFLQVDGKQARRVQQADHELHQLGLHERVFSANDLESAVEAVTERLRLRPSA